MYLSALLMPKMQVLKMTVIDLPMSYVYGLVMLGFVMMTWRAMQVTVRALAARLERARASRRGRTQ